MRPLIRGGVVVLAATFVWQLSNFVFNAVGAHELGPAKYSVLASAMALSYLLNPLVMAVQTVASREATAVIAHGHEAYIRGLVNFYLRRVGGAAVIVAALIIVGSPLLSRLLHLNSDSLVILFALVVPVLIASSIVRGVHQGTQRFERYSVGTIAEGLTKVIGIVAIMTLLGKTPIAGMYALLISGLVALAVNFWLLRHFPVREGGVRQAGSVTSYSLSTFAVFGFMAVLLSIDTMTARLSLPAYLAGLYAGISLTGKIVFFATTAVTTFVFPVLSARIDKGAGTRLWLRSSAAVVIVIGAVIVAVFRFAPRLITDILLGPRYIALVGSLWVMGLVFVLYALLNLVVTYLLAWRRTGLTPVLAAAVLVQIGGFVLFHGSVDDLMGVMSAAFSVGLLGCGVLVVRLSVSSRRASAASGRYRGAHRIASGARPRQAYAPGVTAGKAA